MLEFTYFSLGCQGQVLERLDLSGKPRRQWDQDYKTMGIWISGRCCDEEIFERQFGSGFWLPVHCPV